MKVLFVVNNFYASGNGLSASARRTVKYLREAGLDVRVLSGRNHEAETPQPDYVLKDFKVPVFDSLIQSHGYKFAKADFAVIEEAVKWADVVHLEEPFILQMVTVRVAKRLGVPCTGTYHLHPENLFCSINLGDWKFLNSNTLRIWRDLVFNLCTDIQCPTENVMERLRKFGFKSRLHLISNGIIPDRNIRMEEPSDDPDRPFLVVCIGRLAVEKDQPTLLEAMRYSKYAKRIQLYFAGRGPEADSIKASAKALYDEGVVAYEPIFKFHDRDGLRELAAKADLYIHCATVEVEGLSALEALQQAVVPIIAEGDLTATSQFALDERSLFPTKDAKALAECIDYWLDHPVEREEMGWKYAESTEDYDISKSISALIEMFEAAVASRKA
ncbi:MAG: glycosyltransferase [Bacteroidales bacterium]|nr:glycosyltransferase [Bacteroidales bacterium]